MFNPFAYLASRVRSAVVQGFADGLQDVGALEPDPTPGSPLEALRQRLQALAAPKPVVEPEAIPDEGTTKRRKA